jgi:hypothetical protein
MSAPLPPDLRARVLQAAQREPSPTRDATMKRAWLAAALGAAASLALSLKLGAPPTEVRAPQAIVLAAGGSALFAVVATWLAASRGGSMIGRSRASLVALAGLLPVALLAWCVFGAAALGEPQIPGESTRAHVVCFVFTTLFAIGPFAAFGYLRRGSDPVHPRALGAALCAAAGAWGTMLINVHCAFTSATHLALGHVLPVAVLAAVGALIGGRLFGVRSDATAR